MKNYILPLTLCLLAATITFHSCQKETSGASSSLDKPHFLTVYLTDHQTPIFDSVFIDIQKLEVKPADDSLAGDGWISLAIRPGVYNILRFRNGLDTLFATGVLPQARLKKIRLTLGSENSVIKGRRRFSLSIHDSDKQVVVNLQNSNIDIVSPGQAMFWIDFDASRSIKIDNSGPGNDNGYRLQAHINVFTRSQSGSIEGKVLPLAADALVMAVNGTDTATAIPDHDNGRFKIVGLHAGTYQVLIDGQNGYSDTTIRNVAVRNGEDTHLSFITLH